MRPATAPSLVADIGGTNTRVALAEGVNLRRDSIRRFRNADHPDFHVILRRYLADAGNPEIRTAGVAVAGPVRDGAGELTNLDWKMTEQSLSRILGGCPASLLNDLQAQGHALGHIGPDCLRPLIAAPNAGDGRSQLVIGVGTGFNAAAVHETPCGRLVVASEYGHVGLPVRSDADLDLCRHVASDHDFVAVEDILSGRGLGRLDGWLAGHGAGDAARGASTIMEAIAAGEPRAVEAGRVFARLLGAVAGDLALIHLPFGGIWFAGGVARAFAPHLENFGFLAAFRDKGRFSEFMQQFSVTVIEDDYAALTGCAAYLDARQGRSGV